MGLFQFMNPSSVKSYEISYMLTGKEISRLEKRSFSGANSPAEVQRLLNLAAPMLAKSELAVDCFPHLSGKKAAKLEEMFLQTYGRGTAENVLTQAELTLEEESDQRDALYRITRENPQSQWSGLALRLNGITADQSDKLAEFSSLYDRMNVYGLPLPPDLSGYPIARAANIICLSIGLGFLPEEQGIAFLEQAYRQAQEHYASWDEYLAGYLLGRVFWLYCGQRYLAIASTVDLNICRVLLMAEQSPLRLYPLRQE